MFGGADTTKADLLVQKAEKKYKGGIRKLWTSKSERGEKASDLLQQAANIYKLAKNWECAANTYIRIAEIEKKTDGEPANFYMEAANMQKKYNTAEASKTMSLAIEIMCEEGKIAQAAKTKKTIAETYESEKQYVLAAQYYQEAAELFQIEGKSNITTTSILLKVPELKILAEENKEHIIEGIKIYEQVAKKYLENRLTAGSAKDLIFRIALLHLCNDDTVGAENSLEKNTEEDPTFSNTREYRFVKALIKAIDEKNVQSFSDACWEFNNISPFDRWKTVVLNKIKTLLERSIKDEFPVC